LTAEKKAAIKGNVPNERFLFLTRRAEVGGNGQSGEDESASLEAARDKMSGMDKEERERSR